jgi:hypothetical protein
VYLSSLKEMGYAILRGWKVIQATGFLRIWKGSTGSCLFTMKVKP